MFVKLYKLELNNSAGILQSPMIDRIHFYKLQSEDQQPAVVRLYGGTSGVPYVSAFSHVR